MSDEQVDANVNQLLQLIKTRETATSNVLVSQQTVLKPGPNHWKVASILHVGPRETGEIRHRRLVLETYRHRVGGGYDFENPVAKWPCEDDEIEALRVFLNVYRQAASPGQHAVYKIGEHTRETVDAVIQALESNEVEPSVLAGFIQAFSQHPSTIQQLPSLGESDYRRIVAAALRTAHRSEALRKLRALIDLEAIEQEFQSVLTENWWMLGGRYVRLIPRRDWTAEETLDMLLQSADGYFDIVELKRSNATTFTLDHGVYIVSAEVNRAVNQAAHYISEIESRRDNLVRRYGLDLYKLKAKVLIGHIGDNDEDAGSKRESLRRYNSHLHRIEVVTYDQLVKIAEQVLESNRSETGVRDRDEAFEGDEGAEVSEDDIPF